MTRACPPARGLPSRRGALRDGVRAGCLTPRGAGGDTFARMIRSILAVLAGLMVFFIAVTVLQGMMVQLYPLPAGIDPNDLEALKRALMGMPAGAFAVLLAAYAVGAMCGGAVAAAVAGRRKMLHAAIVGGLTMLAGIANFARLPHPSWVVLVGVPLFVVMALIGGRLGLRLTR